MSFKSLCILRNISYTPSVSNSWWTFFIPAACLANLFATFMWSCIVFLSLGFILFKVRGLIDIPILFYLLVFALYFFDDFLLSMIFPYFHRRLANYLLCILFPYELLCLDKK